MKNRRPDLNGILVVDKPLEWSSADVCRYVRRHTGGAKVGHAGTLDPLATGVLVVCLGTATKLANQIMGTEKVYRAEIDLSTVSTTDDCEGEIRPVEVSTPPTAERIRRVLDERFTGEIEQRPPAFSAVMIEGRRSYKRARAGETVRPEPKRVRIHAVQIAEYVWPRLILEITCGKGTYIRSLARDLGEALGTGGMLTGLVRTRVGRFKLQDAQTPEHLPDPLEANHLQTMPSDPA